MCGICGILDWRENVPPQEREARVRAMCATLVHRGPDMEGVRSIGSATLGSRRLSIIDLAGGMQPISNEDGSVWVVFNGEVYNFQDLRARLEERGHRFRTGTDTETIVHAYEDDPEDFLSRLNGMFAFVLWDETRGRLIAARDRLGKKPFYYASPPGRFLFGSSIASILASREVQPDLDLVSVHHYLSLQWVPDPRSIVSGIRKLPAGHRLDLDASTREVRVRPWWRPRYEPKSSASMEASRQELRVLLEDAVRLRMISDVPLGAFLSGGIDSSIVVALMSRLAAGRVKTFSIGFREREFDESPHARVAAERFGTDHHEFVLDPDIAGLLSKLIWYLDEPLADPAVIPTYVLAREARRFVTVALNGDGGDEAFAGYQRYWYDPVADGYARVPRAVRKVVEAALGALPCGGGAPVERDLFEAARRLHQAADAPRGASILRWGSYFGEAEKLALFRPEVAAEACPSPTERLLVDAWHQAAARDPFDRTLATDLTWYLPMCLMAKTDRPTMAASLEARSPFLDYRVIEFAARLPRGFRVRGCTGKVLLRRAFADLLPPDLNRRGKQGFGVPLSLWFRGAIRGFAEERILGGRLMRRLFRPAVVRRYWDQHQNGVRDHGKRLYALLVLELWHESMQQARSGCASEAVEAIR